MINLNDIFTSNERIRGFAGDRDDAMIARRLQFGDG
jgi:hypothetical protein